MIRSKLTFGFLLCGLMAWSTVANAQARRPGLLGGFRLQIGIGGQPQQESHGHHECQAQQYPVAMPAFQNQFNQQPQYYPGQVNYPQNFPGNPQYYPSQYQPNQYQPNQYQPNQYQPNQYQPNQYPNGFPQPGGGFNNNYPQGIPASYYPQLGPNGGSDSAINEYANGGIQRYSTRYGSSPSQPPQLGFNGRMGSTGIQVLSVESHGPAAAAGLKAGDLVVRINGERIGSSTVWNNEMGRAANVGRVVLTVMDGRTEQIFNRVISIQ